MSMKKRRRREARPGKPELPQCQHRSGMEALLEPWESKQLCDYLHGRAPSLRDNRFFPPETVAGRRLALMIDLLINAGLKAAELVRLRVQDTPLLLVANVIAVCESEHRQGRTIPIHQSLASEIKEYIQLIRPKTMPQHHRRGDPSLPVFYNQLRRPYTTRDIAGIISSVFLKFKASSEPPLDACGHPRQSTGVIPASWQRRRLKEAPEPPSPAVRFAVKSYISGVRFEHISKRMGHEHLASTDRYLCPAVPSLQILADGDLGGRLDCRPFSSRV